MHYAWQAGILFFMLILNFSFFFDLIGRFFGRRLGWP
jgi:hypothetical protein